MKATELIIKLAEYIAVTGNVDVVISSTNDYDGEPSLDDVTDITLATRLKPSLETVLLIKSD